MLKWILTLVIAIFLLGIIAPHAARFIRFGQLPAISPAAFAAAATICRLPRR